MAKPEEVEVKMKLVHAADGNLYLMGKIPDKVDNVPGDQRMNIPPQFAMRVSTEVVDIAYANETPRKYRIVQQLAPPAKVEG